MSNTTVNTLTGKWCVCLFFILSGACFTHGELMVDFVDVFVDPAVMQQAMQKVVPGIFNNSTAKALSQNIWPVGGDRERKVLFRNIL